MLSKCANYCVAFTLCAFSLAAGALAPKVEFPLDALTPQEYWTIYKTMRDAGHAGEKTIFASILLHEPTKQAVLAWKSGDPITREADVVMLDEGKSYAALVDISAKKVEDYHELKGEQANFTSEEEHEVDEGIKHDPRIVDALKKRGITDLRHTVCFATPAGFIDLPEQKDPSRRIGWGGCTDAEGSISGPWDREVPGLFFVVDMTTKKVLRVTDYGAVPMAETTGIYDAMGGEALPGTKPVTLSMPEGPSFTIDKGLISWMNWRFRFRIDPRGGVILNNVGIMDQGAIRPIMYEGGLSEMYVPYEDPEETWNSHVFLDAGEYFMNTGLGMLKPLVAGIDCPDYGVFFSTFMAREDGAPFERPQTVCLFERTKGDPAWRHSDENGTFGRPSRELVLRSVATVGNYDYILDWRFEEDGTITGAVGATGILEVKPVSDTNVSNGMSAGLEDKNAPGGPVQFGTLIAPGIDAVDHDHFFSFRLDLDVDGVTNSFMSDKLVPYKIPGNKETYGRHVIWAMQPTMPKTESEGMQDISMQHPTMWRFISDKKGPLGNPTGYALMPGLTAATLLPPDEWPSKRAAFADHQLWVTPYEPGERYAAGTYVSGSRGTDGLGAWTKKNRNIMNTDIVAWYTVGFHHNPRAEDWPQMPTMWHEFQLMPFNFFPKNPGMDLPMKP